MKGVLLNYRWKRKVKRVSFDRQRRAMMRVKIFILTAKVNDRVRFINDLMKGNITEYPRGLYNEK